MSSQLIDKDGFIFVAKYNGETISISVPAKTGNDWTRKERFLNLPLMNKESLNLFIEALIEMRELFYTTKE